jgi:tetratricopeptide (TPR) repeat protein
VVGEDRYGLPVTTTSEAALGAYCEALDLALAQRDGARQLLSQALETDEAFALAWALLGLQQRAVGDITGGNQNIQRAVSYGAHCTERERSHLGVLERFAFATDTAETAIQEHLAVWPRDAVIVMQAHYFYNIMDSRPDRDTRMLATDERVAPAYGDDWFMLGELAFAAEENGSYSQARELAEQSLAGNPMNAMAAHPLAHVFLETGGVEEGTRWLQGWLAGWDRPSVFACHLTWHLALFRLAVGDLADVTSLLGDVIGYCGRSVGALSDGSSLSWRLKLDGYDTDLPWPKLVALPDRPGFTFGNAHRALALAGQGDTDGLVSYGHVLEALAASGHPTAGDCAQFTRALRDLIGADPGQAADRLVELLPRFRNFGGSHAQTEVFEDTTIAALEMSGRRQQAGELLTTRLARRRSGRDERWLARLRSGSKD